VPHNYLRFLSPPARHRFSMSFHCDSTGTEANASHRLLIKKIRAKNFNSLQSYVRSKLENSKMVLGRYYRVLNSRLALIRRGRGRKGKGKKKVRGREEGKKGNGKEKGKGKWKRKGKKEEENGRKRRREEERKGEGEVKGEREGKEKEEGKGKRKGKGKVK